MRGLLVLLFIVVPLVELAIIIQVGQLIGPAWTIVTLLAVSLAGAWLVRREGTRAWSRFRGALGSGRVPTDEVVDGALVLLGGALLLTPGFATDAVGLLLMVPPVRTGVASLLKRRLGARFAVTSMGVGRGAGRGADGGVGTGAGGGAGGGVRGRGPSSRRRRDEVVDVEVVNIERSSPSSGAAANGDIHSRGGGSG